jgi:nitroimidazol reductase NimA-like FMN-containing flavoprotein (pyridoxamine 5'-phosphate oxidase superfamily)
MRRQELEIKDTEEVIAILEKCQSLVLGMIDTTGNNPVPYTVPLNFSTIRTNDGLLRIYFHGAKDGRKMDILEKNNTVCFTAILNEKISDENHPEDACKWTTHYESIFGTGVAKILYGPLQPKRQNESGRPDGLLAIAEQDQIRHEAMDALMQKSGFKGKPTYITKMIDDMPIIEVTVDELTGKRR